MTSRSYLTVLLLLLLLTSACGSNPANGAGFGAASPTAPAAAPEATRPPPTVTTSAPWTLETVAFSFGADELHGVLTLPAGEGPHPAMVLISGSVNTTTGARSGASLRYFREHAEFMARRGFAVLRYDPPGVGRSSGQSGFETLDQRAEEAMAALRALQSRPAIQGDRVGLWGGSQGAWVIAMAAARYPEEVAFLVSVSGSGVSVAEQQVYGIEAQSRAAGLEQAEVDKAGLFGRLLVDWQLDEPLYREANEGAARALDEGPWSEFLALVYEPGEISVAEGLARGIEILKAVQDEPWAEFLYLKELYLPQLESLSPEQVAAVRALTGPNLLNDPKEYMTAVQCPVLAVFGEEDLHLPAERSAALYETYLTEAGNNDFQIEVIPKVGHGIDLSMPAYRRALADWLAGLPLK